MAAFALALVAVAASCGTGVRTASDAAEVVRVSCGPGGQGFPEEALHNPTGAENADTPEAAGLRSVIASSAGVEELPRTGWRLLDRNDDGAVFGAESGDGLTVVALRPDGHRWVFSGSAHGCRELMVVPPDGVSAAVWWPDPDRDHGDELRLHVLATDRSCASGRPTGDRLRPPSIAITDDSVVITFSAEPVSGSSHTCQAHRPTPYQVELDEPIGDRQLLDGAYWPPRPPKPQP